MMDLKSITTTTLLLFVSYALPLTAQTDELQSLRWEIDGLKAGQQAIQADTGGFSGEECIEAARQLPTGPFVRLLAIAFRAA